MEGIEVGAGDREGEVDVGAAAATGQAGLRRPEAEAGRVAPIRYQ